MKFVLKYKYLRAPSNMIKSRRLDLPLSLKMSQILQNTNAQQVPTENEINYINQLNYFCKVFRIENPLCFQQFYI